MRKILNLESEKVIDFDESIEIYKNKESLYEILKLLDSEITKIKHDIISAHEKPDHDELSRVIHKFNGCVGYTCTPRLKNATKSLYICLLNKEQNINPLVNNLLDEIDIFIDTYNEIKHKNKDTS